VRPTDENQAGSTRPNLMSSRRGAGEENILAMLERDSARRTGPRMSGVRMASYGAAAALAGILAGGVAWLAYDNHQGMPELQAHHEVVNEPVPAPLPDAVLPPQAPPAVAAANPADVPHAAVIVDEAARKRDTVVASAPASTIPPLVMLPPHELNGAKPAPTAARAAQDTPPAKAEKTEQAPVQKPVPVQAQAPVQKQIQKPAQVQARSSPEKKADKAQKPASRSARPATAPARGKATPKVAAKGKPDPARNRKAAPNAEPAVDSDVALISAIIQHAERHRGERAVATPPAVPPAKNSRR
jgi:hypothetical protein